MIWVAVADIVVWAGFGGGLVGVQCGANGGGVGAKGACQLKSVDDLGAVLLK